MELCELQPSSNGHTHVQKWKVSKLKQMQKKISGKKKQYSKEMLAKAVEEVKTGASLRATAKKYSIPYTTLQDYKTNKYSHNPHPNSALTPAEEGVLISFLLWMADHGFPVTRSIVKILAIGIIKESGRTQSTTVNLEKGPSDVWWSRFKARHPELTSRMADSLDRSRVHGATPQAVEGFFNLFEVLYMKHGLDDKPQLIYNCTETGFADGRWSRETIPCQTARKQVYKQQQTNRKDITVHCCVSAAGDSIPPFIIYPGCLPSNNYRLEGPPNALYGIQEEGSMDSELFLKWLWHFVRYAPEERPLILIMDQHETRVSKDVISYCRENNIEILCLPAHTTRILQPLDISIFEPLKTAFSTMASSMGLVPEDLVVEKNHFSALLKKVYPTAVTAQNIKTGFRRAGIFPLSKGAVDTTQVVRVLLSASGSDATPSSTPIKRHAQKDQGHAQETKRQKTQAPPLTEDDGHWAVSKRSDVPNMTRERSECEAAKNSSTFVRIDGWKGVYYSESWESNGSTLYLPVRGTVFANVHKYEQLSSEHGCFGIADQTGHFLQNVHGQALHCWRYSKADRKLFIALSYFFTNYEVFQEVLSSLPCL